MKFKALLFSLLIGIFCLTTTSCSSDDDATETENSQNEVRKDMSIEVSYSGDFETGVFVVGLTGMISEGDSASQVAPLIDERDNKPYGPIMIQNDESTTAETLKFHSENKIAGIFFNAAVQPYDSQTDIEVTIKTYVEGELVDERTFNQSNASPQVNYTISAEDN